MTASFAARSCVLFGLGVGILSAGYYRCGLTAISVGAVRAAARALRSRAKRPSRSLSASLKTPLY